MNYVRRSPINGSVKAVFIAMFAAVLLIGSSPAKAQTGCEPACSGYPANSQSLTCACRAVCSRLICPAGSGAPTFIESKQCPPGPDSPAHTVSRICCTGTTNGRTKCKPVPSCKTLSRS